MLDIRVSAKQAVSIYGLQRFPITLYREQWETIIRHQADILSFIREHDSELKRKENASESVSR